MLREGVRRPFTAQPSTSHCWVSVSGRNDGAMAILADSGEDLGGMALWHSFLAVLSHMGVCQGRVCELFVSCAGPATMAQLFSCWETSSILAPSPCPVPGESPQLIDAAFLEKQRQTHCQIKAKATVAGGQVLGRGQGSVVTPIRPHTLKGLWV